MKALTLKPIHYKILLHLALAEEGKLTRYRLSKKIYGANYVTLLSRYLPALESEGLITIQAEKVNIRKKIFVYITKKGFNALLEQPSIPYEEIENYVKLALKEMNIKCINDENFRIPFPYSYSLITTEGIIIRVEDGFRPPLSNVLRLLAEIKNDDSKKRRRTHTYILTPSLMKSYVIELFDDKRLIAASPNYVENYRGIIIFSGNHPKKILAKVNKILQESGNKNEKQNNTQEKPKGLSKKDLEKDSLESPTHFLEVFKKILEEALWVIDRYASKGSRIRVIFAGDLSVSEFLNTLKRTIQELQNR